MTINSSHTYARLAEDLAYRFESVCTREEVAQIVERTRTEIEPTSRHPEFLPVLVEKAARDHLTSLSRTRTGQAHGTPEFLFVCEHNEGRSQMAAAITEHLTGGTVHVRSAGVTPTGLLNPVVVAALAERGITLEHAYPTRAEDDVLTAADVVVTMGRALPEMPGRHQVHWDIEDPHHRTLEIVRAIRDDIEARLVDLLQEFDIQIRADRLHSQARPAAAPAAPEHHRTLRERLHLAHA